MKKTFAKIVKTVTCFVMSAFMVLTLMPTNVNLTTAFAQDTQGFTIKVNTEDSSISNDIHVTYGDDMDFTLEGTHYQEGVGDLKFLRLSYPNPDPSSSQWTEIDTTHTPSTTTWPVGSYYLGYQYYVDDNNSWDNGNGDFKVTVDKDTANAPANLDWQSGSVAKWDAVTTTTHNRSVEISTYTVSLYKDGIATALDTQTTSSTTYDFSSLLDSQSEGNYYFTVVANVTDTDSYNDSSVATSGDTHKVMITVAKGTGIASVTPAASFYLMSGDGPQAITATATSGGAWEFDEWTSSEENISFTDASVASTNVSVDKDYEGTNIVTVTAVGKDVLAPTISNFAKKAGSHTQLTGTAVDNETGIAAYAFSTATTAGEVEDEEWTEVSKAAGETLTADYTLSAKGNYYFYVKDNHGNIAQSTSDILVSKIIYNNYTLASDYLIGTGDTVTLPASPVKAGWTFNGWYDTDALENQITQVTNPATASDINVYAKWIRQQVSFKTQPQSYSGTYDAANHALTVAVNNTSGTITYQWYKKGESTDTAIEGATSSTYNVKNYADSGQYYVIVSIEDEDGQVVTGTSDVVTVSIAQATLTVKADSFEINYKDAAPTYTAKITGYKGADTESVVTKGTITSTYQQGDNADEYDIVPAGYSADNYSFSYVNGKLTVKPLDVNAAGSEVEIAFADPTAHYYYDGTAKVPVITVKDGDDTIAASNYDVSYSPDNIHAGTVTLTVTFKQSYKGSLQLTFVIEKRTETPSVVISDWTYDGTAHAPSLNGYNGTAAPVYYYKASSATEYTTTAPVNAGTYSVYAVIPATEDDNGYTTAVVTFEIKKVNITITAPTNLAFVYTGAAHQILQNYQVTGTFVGTDALKSTTYVYAKDSTNTDVGKTVTLAGNYTTHISYELTATTNANNYKITTVDGTCVVGKATLSAPTEIKWKTTAAGTADWLAVVADNVTIEYEVALYKQGQTAAIETVTTAESEYDFASTIQNDCATAGAAGGYYFKVKAKITGGSSAANYNNSDYTDASAQLNTIAVQLVNAGGIGTLKLGGTVVTSGQTVYLFSGQTVSISAQAATGYTLSSTVWTTNSTLISIETATISDTNITVNALGTPGTAVQTIEAHASDNPPSVTSFTGSTNAARTQVTLNLKAEDELGISAYAIKKDDQTTPTAAQWTAWAGGNLDVNEIVTEPGTYYAFVKDTSGNVVESEVNIVIYKIEFDGGEGAVGTMAPILKIQNVSETLPANAFTKEGHSWVGWVGDNTGAYGDEFDYDANSSDVLRAKWDIHVYTYTVNYYLEDLTTGYPTTPSSTATFEATHGTVVSTTTESIQLSDLKGMTVDSDHAASITVNQNGLVINVYYKINRHKITYTYTDTEAATQTIVENYKYGETVTEHAKPAAVDGWIFKGWDFGGAGSLPSTMPDYDIEVTGEYISTSTHYDIVYFEEKLDGTYEEVTTVYTASVHAIHGDALTADSASAGSISAYTYAGTKITYGEKGSTDPEEGYIQTTDTGTVDAAHHTYINYYFTRNSYTITLKVYKRDSDNTLTQIYTHAFAAQKYGTPISDVSVYEDYGYHAIEGDTGSGWGDYYEDPNIHGYKIQDQASWSCGDAPSTQPSSNITVSRYIVEQQPSFFVESYFQKADGTYVLESKNLYSMNPDGQELTYGQTVSIGTGTGVTVDYTSSVYKKNFKYSNYLDYFEYDTAKNATDGVLSGTVVYSDTESGYLTLKIYFARRTKSMTINYYYDDDLDGNYTKFYTATWDNVVWGNSKYAEITALFDSGTNWVGGVVPDTAQSVSGQESWVSYDFRKNNYMVMYSTSYTTENIGHGGTTNVESESALTSATNVTVPVGQSGTTINVYYYAIPTPQLVYIDMQWKYNVGTANSNTNLSHFRNTVAQDAIAGQSLTAAMPLTYTYGGTTYKVRVVSEPYVFSDSTYQAVTTYTVYPALNILNGQWTNGTTLKPGFSTINVDGTDYYVSTEGSDHYIYYLKSKVFTGGSPWFSYPANAPGASEVSAKATLYANTYKDIAQGEQYYDEYAKFAYLERSGFYSILRGNSTYTMSINYYPTRRVYHSINGLRCNGHLVRYYDNATGDDLVCEDTSWAQAPEGYSPVWFKDSDLTEPVTSSTSIPMNGTDQFLYGKFALSTLDCYDWAFYRVLRNTTDTQGVTYSEGAYLTEAQIATMEAAEDPKLVVTEESSVDVYVNDSLGIPREYTITTTKYVLDGQLVAVKRNHPTIAFSSTSMNWSATKVADGTTVTFSEDDFNAFYSSTGGYAFSSTDSRNVIATTIGGTATVSGTSEAYLKKYYTYTWPTYTVNNNYNDALNTPEKSQPHYGKEITLTTPSETGYRFTGWVFTKDNGTGQGEVWADAPTWSEGQESVTFTMPSFSVTATAQWVDADVDTVITHYLQTVSGDYLTTITEGLENGQTVTVSYGGSTYSGTLYDNGVITVTDSYSAGPHTMYFSGGTEKSGVYTVVLSDLCAIRCTTQKLNHSTSLANADALDSSKLPHFTYSYTVRKTSAEVARCEGTQTISYGNGVSIDLYYARESGLKVRTAAFIMTGSNRGNGGGTIVGDGSYVYYQEISTVITPGRGYSMTAASTITPAGWYYAEDVLKDYDASSSTPLKDYELKDDLTGLTPLCANSEEYTFNVEKGVDLVALVMPTLPELPTTTISGKQSYVYDYVDHYDNTINVTYTMPEGSDGTTIVNNYKWYRKDIVEGEEVWTEIPDYHSATYNIPQGLDVGTYTYKCEVCVMRIDNSNTDSVFTDEFTIEVTEATWSPEYQNLTLEPYSGVYDGEQHGMTLIVLKPTDASTYQVYYRVGTPINTYAECSDDDVTTTNPTRKDVGTYTVYYYIHSKDGNYYDAKGSSTITITPATVTLKATNIPYTRVYDGTTDVTFSEVIQGTTGQYTVDGTFGTDTLTVSGTAVYNDAHVAYAASITLSNLSSSNANYVFAEDYTYTVPGTITQFTVYGALSQTTKTYNGQEQKPVFTLTAGQSIPDSGLGVLVTGFTNAGTHTTVLTVNPTTLNNGGLVSDYKIDEEINRDFVINPIAITVTPKARTVEYDGTTYTLNDYVVSGSALVSGHSVKAVEMANEYTNAGIYDGIAISKAYIKDDDDNDYTDNYSITYGSNTLTITKRPVTISGITATDKEYDGNKVANLVLTDAEFANIVSGDTLSLDATKVTGEFASAAAWEDKVVTITYADDALTGASAANYYINTTDSQKTTTASITKGTITVKADGKTVTYGDSVTFTATYTGMIEGETSSVVTGKPSYQITSDDGETWSDYSTETNAGSYFIRVNTNALSAVNYDIEWDDEASEMIKTQYLLVNQRQITVTENASYTAPSKGVPSSIVLSNYYTINNVVNGDNVGLSFTAAFDDKDVADATKIGITDLAISDTNYKLATTGNLTKINAKITKKDLTVTIDNKTITYGAAAPTYTYSLSGLVSGESDNESMTVGCSTYNTSAAATRHVGTYDIEATDDYEDGNYNIIYANNKKGTLTVSAKTLTVTAKPKTITYGDAPANDGVTYSGFEYSEDETTALTGTLAYTYTYSQYGAAGSSYTITPSGLSNSGDYANYSISYVAGKLTVNKKDLTIAGITSTARDYNGTTAATLDTTAATYTGLEANDNAYKFGGSATGKMTVTGAYADKHAGTDKTVTLTITPGTYISARYTLKNCQTTTTSTVNKINATVTADDKTVQYGKTAPTYTYTSTGFLTGETPSTDYTGTMFTLSGTYEPEVTAVGPYTDAITFNVGTYVNKNYNITFVAGDIEVTNNKFPAPSPSFSVGTVSWTAIADVAGVAVQHYNVKLYKDDSTTAVYDQNVTTTSVDLESTIRTNGAGKYTVKVQAVTSDDTKVDSSTEGTATTYAANVTFVYATDAVTTAGSEGCSATIAAAAGSTGYIVIAGQTNIALSAGIKNATGYSLNSCTVTTGTGLTISDSGITGTTYSGKVAAAQTMTITSGVITLKLNATPATAQIAIEGDPASAYFGYPAKTGPDDTEENPTPTVKIKSGYPKAADGDTYTGYTYTYQWQVKFGLTDSWHDVAASSDGTVSDDNRTYTFPTGKSVGTGYKVRCVIVATRADNGMSTPAVTETDAVGKSVIQGITIKHAYFSSMTTLTGWTYGTAPNTPSVTSNPGNAEVDYYYSNVEDTPIEECLTTQPTDAGTWYVKAYIHESDDYAEYETSDTAFTIAKGQLVMSTPTFDGTTGTASWTAPDTIYEGGDSAKHAVNAASYDVALYKKTGTTWTIVTDAENNPVKHNTTETSYDFTNDIAAYVTTAGTYAIGVVAKSDDSNNVKDSAEVKTADITFFDVTVIDLADNVAKTSKTYDKYNALQMTVVLDGASATSYEWYKDDSQVAGASAQSYGITKVDQSGIYVAKVKNGNNVVGYTIAKRVTIQKKEIHVAWQDPDPIYNKREKITYCTVDSRDIIDFDPNNPPIDFTFSENQKTDVGEYTAEVEIGGTDGGNYFITQNDVTHDWEITPKTIGITWTDTSFTYDKTAHIPTATATGLCTVGGETDECTITVTGEQTNASTTAYTATAISLSNSNYQLPTDVTQTFTINPKEAVLKWAPDSLEFTYDGTNQKPTCSVDNLEDGDTCTVTVTVPGDYSDVAEYTATAASLSNSNYKLPTANTTTYNIVQRQLAVTWPETNTFTYNNQERSYEPTLSNKVTGDTVTAVLSGNKATVVGNYTSTITSLSGADAANYYVADADKTHAWSIGQKEVTLSWANLEFTYDKQSHLPTATVTNLESGDAVSVTVVLDSTSQTAATDAGTYTAKASALTGTNAAQYKLPSANTKQFKINPKEIGITWTDLEFTYDGANHKPTATATGVVTGDTCTITVSGEQKNASATDYTATAASLSNSNYKLPTAVTKAFKINPLTVAIEWGTTSFTYNGQSQCPTATVDNLVTGDTCTITVTGGKTNTNYVDGSTNYTATAASVSNTNYVLPTANTTTFTIGRKDIAGATITLGTALTYTGSEQTQTVSKVVIDGLEATYSVSNNKQTNAGTYSGTNALVVTGTGNFTGTESKEFTIAQASNSWTTTPSIANWTYGSTASTPSSAAKFGTAAVTYYGTANDGVAYAESSTVPTKAGSYTAKFVVTETTNYAGLETTVNFTINKKTVGISWGATAFTYNGSDQCPTATATGLVGNDSVSVTVTGAKKDSNAKTETTNYTATADALTGADKDNYTLPATKPTTAFTIAQKEVGVDWGATAFTYNGNDQCPTATATGLIGSESVSITVTGAKKDSNAKTGTTNYTATADALTGTDALNYTLPSTKPTTAFTIAPFEVGITWTHTSDLVYNGNAQKPEATATGLIGQDAAGISVSGEKTDSNAKAGVATYTATAASIDNGNYKLPTANTTTFTIAQKSITGATVNLGAQLVYSGVEQTQTVDSVIIDSLNATYSVSGNKATNVGLYTLTVTGTGNFKDSTTKDFSVSLAANEWTVDPAIADWTYGETASTPVGTAKHGNETLVIKYSGTLKDGTAYAETTAMPSKAGDYTATFTVPETGNYSTLEKSVTFHILQREVTITWSDTALTYNGNAQKPTATAGNLVNSDTVNVTVSGEETDANAKSGRTYTATAASLSNANYKLPAAAQTTEFTIGQKEVTLTWGKCAFTYNGQPQKPEATANGLVGQDTCTVTVDGAKTDASDVAYMATATALSDANYKLPSDATKDFTIGKKTVSVTWPTITVLVYNGNIQNITPTIGDIVSGDKVSLVVTGDKATDVSDNLKAEVTGLKGAKAGNYKLPATGLEKTWQITPYEISLVWSHTDDLTYNGQAQKPEVQVSGTFTGDTCNVTVVDGAKVDSNAKSGEASYTAEAKALDNANYKLPSDATTTFTIGRKSVSLEWSHTNDLVYNGQAQKPVATAKGLCGNDECTVTVSGEQVNAGTGYTATATALSDANYKLPATATTQFSIGTKAVTVQIGSATRKYDGTALTCNDFSADGFVEGEGIESCEFKSEIKNVGTADNIYVDGTSVVTPKSGTVLANYSITWNKGSLTVTKRTVKLTSESAEAAYNGTALTKHEVKASVDGFASGEGATYTYTGSQTNVGESDNTFTYELNAGTLEGNYNITTAAGELKVTPAAITITADDQTSKRLEEEIKTLTGKITQGQLYGTDEITISGTTTATKTSPSGVYDIVPTYEFVSGLAGNYTVTLVNGKYTLVDVTKGTATLEMVLAEGVTAQFGDKDAALKSCISDEDEQSLVDGKNIEYKLSIEYMSDTEVPEADRTAIEDQIKNAGIENLKNGRYMSISILKKVGDDEWEEVTEVKDEVAIVLTIPSDLNFDGATYYVGRVHNGKGETLKDTDKEGNTVTFSTKLFSTYSLEYARKTDPSPATGDNNNPWLWLLLLGLSATTLGVATYKRRKSVGR